MKTTKRIVLNHDLVRIVENSGKVEMFIKMGNGEWAVQRPYEGDLRGLIGAMTLAIDVLAGKIILGGTTRLDEVEFKTEKIGRAHV